MNSSHVCLACRRRLNQIRPYKVSQWHSQATFISLSVQPRTTVDEKSRGGLWMLGDEGEGKKAKYDQALQERRKRMPRAISVNNAGDQLESLFEESLKLPVTSAKTSRQPLTSIEPYMNAETLRKMLADRSCPVVDSWQFFVQHFGPEAWRKGSIDRRTSPSYLTHTGRILLKEIIDSRSKDPFSVDLPSVTEISRVYSQLGMLHGPEWADMMYLLLESLLRLEKLPLSDLACEERLILDVLGAWNVVCRQIGKPHIYPSHGATSLDWSHLPSISTYNTIQAQQRRGPQGPFGLLVPTFPFRYLKDVPAISVATFALLTKDSTANRTAVNEASPLLSVLGQVISVRGFETGHLAEAHGRSAASVIEFSNRSWSETRALASKMCHSTLEKKVREARPSISSIRMDSSFLHKRLYDALSRRDAHQVDRLWADAVQFPIHKGPPKSNGSNATGFSGTPQRGSLTVAIYNYFILIYMALRQPNRAIDVWNHMVKGGLPPNLATWDSMMMGCKMSRDSKALEDVWTKMQILGVKPDVVCWTTRISGLIECHQVDKAMQALDEMGRLWLEAVRQNYGKVKIEELRKIVDVPGAVKPTIETINAAVAGLLRKHKPEAAHRILAWAGSYGITPNVITYNTLLRSLVREGRSKEAMALLQEMQKDGIQADVGTFTTILDETFCFSDEYSPEEQKEIIANLFSEMEAAGVKANIHTYSKIIYQLLQSAKGDLRAVNTVIEHMARHGLQPTTYIYTILVDHYFCQQPPHIYAIRSLIEHTSLDVGSVDHIFWDRVIEGYARVGDTTSAIRILGQVNSGNSKASWMTLQTLLSALVQNQEWDVARSLVRNLKVDTGGPLYEHGIMWKEGQQRFWRLAAELELVEL